MSLENLEKKTGLILRVSMERVFEDLMSVILNATQDDAQTRATVTVMREELIEGTSKILIELFEKNASVKKKFSSQKGNLECLALGRHHIVGLLKDKAPECFDRELMQSLFEGIAPR